MAYLKQRTLIGILNSNDYFEIPIYQRNYTWSENECIKFLGDIYENFMKNKIIISEQEIEYYVGNVIIFNFGANHDIIVDGQQRITTTILILCALRNVIKITNDKVDPIWIEKNINSSIKYNTCNFTNSKEIKLKLNNIKNSRELEDIIEERVFKDNCLKSNFYKNVIGLEKFIKTIKKNDDNFAQNIITSLEKTLLIQVNIKKHDDPNKIFEVINTTGKKLLPSDLIKNFIFFYSTNFHNDIKNLSNKYDQLEKFTGNNDKELMSFFRYIVPILGNGLKLQAECSNAIYEDFKSLFKLVANSPFYNLNLDNIDNVHKVLDEIIKHAEIWYKISHFTTDDKKTKYLYEVFKSSFNTYYSLVHQYLLLYGKNEKGKLIITNNCMKEIFNLIARLMFSLLLQGRPEKNITREIPNIIFMYQKEKENNQTFINWFENRQNSDIKLLSFKDIKTYIKQSTVYVTSSKKTKLLLAGIEMVACDWEIELDFNDFTVEHILPQNVDKESDFWLYALEQNENDELKAEEWCIRNKHTLSNLTLVKGPLNSAMSNKPLNTKKQYLHDNTILIINRKIEEYTEWKDKELDSRAAWLTEKILKLLEL